MASPEDRLHALLLALATLTERLANQAAPVIHIHFDGAGDDDERPKRRKPWKADRETDGWDGIGPPRPYVS